MQTCFLGACSEQGMAKALNIYNFWRDAEHHPALCTFGLRYLFKYNRQILKRYNYPNSAQLIQVAHDMMTAYLNTNNLQNAREIADIISEYHVNEGERFFQRLRALDEVKIENKVIKTVYADSQNVHNSKINNSVIRSATKLCELYNVKLENEIENKRQNSFILSEIEAILKRGHKNASAIIEKSIEYIRISTATFGEKRLSLCDILVSVWLFIINHAQRADLELRLIEELKDMNGLCSTGHVARLVNVIQGFTSSEELQIRISDAEQCKAVVGQYLSNVLKECKDENVLDGILDGSDAFVHFVRVKVADKLLEWKSTYGADSLPIIARIVNEYCGNTVFAV